MRRMFGKVFIAFWGSSLIVVLSMGILGLMLGSRPILYLWLTHFLDVYAQTATDLYQRGGEDILKQYLDDVQKHSAIDGALIDPQGVVLSGHPIPLEAQSALTRAKSTGKSQYNQQNWTAAILVPTSRGNYILAVKIHPWRRRRAMIDPSRALSRVAAGVLVAALLCMLMARYLTRPIRNLQSVARRIAAGDLTARAAPLLGKRNDELSELAFDFDQMAAKVQTLIERQQILLRDISHELRSPLTRLTLSAELVRRGDTSALQRIDADIHRLESLISELLTLSRIETSDGTTRKDVVNLAHMVRQIIQDAEFEGRPEGKEIVQTGMSDLVIAGDANLLQRCIENVIRNAVHYTKARTTIEVNLDRGALLDAAPAAVIRVIDEGPGVPPEALPHLFEPFFRVSASRTQKDGGTGLGLSISQRIAILHRGRIEASNRPEGGLEVAICFPLKTA